MVECLMWKLIENEFDPAKQLHSETIFTIGNGYLSTRGALEEGILGENRATFIHGRSGRARMSCMPQRIRRCTGLRPSRTSGSARAVMTDIA